MVKCMIWCNLWYGVIIYAVIVIVSTIAMAMVWYGVVWYGMCGHAVFHGCDFSLGQRWTVIIVFAPSVI